MHKSEIFLIGLLVILLPLGTSFNISNANAIADFDKADKKQVSVSSLKCNNINVNINGLELDVFPPFLADSDLAAEALEANTDPSSFAGNGDTSEINDFRFICINNNNNTVVEQEPIPPVPPTPPEPTPGSLTIKKEIFGCDNIELPPPVFGMNCQILQNNSQQWLNCNANTNPTDVVLLCQPLLENFFDIEVLDNQNNPVRPPFEGSQQGTTIQDLEPGTYTVNEIRHDTSDNQLGTAPEVTQSCMANGFAGGGVLFNTNLGADYRICFEYEDEQGNDCTTNTIASNEEKICIVKNYIEQGSR